MDGPPTPHLPPHTHAKSSSIFNAKLDPKNLENQGRYEGDWGVYGKVLTSGSPQDRKTSPHPYPTPTPSQKHKIIVIGKTCFEEPGETKAGTRVIGVYMERS